MPGTTQDVAQQVPALLPAGVRLKASEDYCCYFHFTAILQRSPDDKKNTASKAITIKEGWLRV